MKKKIIIPLKEPPKRGGAAIMLYVPEDYKESLKIIGGGKISKGLRVVLDTYYEEISQAAQDAKRAS